MAPRVDGKKGDDFEYVNEYASDTAPFSPTRSRSNGDEVIDSGEKRLTELGYKQELRRRFSFLGAFGLTFSILSVLLGPNTLYATAIANGGPVSVVWGWILVSIMTLMVAASMCEISSAYPTAGGPYFWAHHLIPEEHAIWKPLACWVTGWCNVIGTLAGTGSVVFSCTTLLTTMITINTGGANGGGWIATQGQTVLISAGIIFFLALWNSLKIEYQNFICKFAAGWNLLGACTILICLPIVATQHQSASWVFGTFINNSQGITSNVYVFMLGLLLPQYQLSGYDGAFHCAEETKNADWATPVGLLLALLASEVLGFIYLLSITFCIQDYQRLFDPNTVTGGLYPVAQIMWDVFQSRFNSGVGCMIFLTVILFSIFLSANSNITSNARMIYAFSRDGAIPGSFLWHRLDKNRTPVMAVWFAVTIALILIFPYIWSTVAFNAVVSICTIGLYCAYGFPIFLRTFICRRNFVPGPFHLGWWSFYNGTISCLWVGFITAIFVMPTVYPVTFVNLNFAGIAITAWIVVVMIYWQFYAKNWFTGPRTNLDVEII